MREAIGIAAELAAELELPIPGDWLVQGGAFGLLLLGIWMILTGRLVPRSTLERVERECEYWRQIAFKSTGHTEQLLPAAHIATQVSRALTDQVDAALHDAALRDLRPRPAPAHDQGGQP